MLPPLEERRAWLDDPVLSKDLAGFARSIVRHRSGADDVRQDALLIAWRIMRDDRGPAEKAGMRPWTFGITKKVAANWLRKRQRDMDLTDVEKVPDLAAEDDREVAANIIKLDQRAALIEDALEKNPEHAENIRIAQEQQEGNLRIMDVAAARGITPEAMRKSISRSRLHVQTIVVAAMAAVAAWFLVPRQPAPADGPSATLTDAQLAASARELGMRNCQAKQWKTCLAELDEAKKLDPAGDATPAILRARHDADEAKEKLPIPPTWFKVADVRSEGLKRCQAQSWAMCLSLLDAARKYDPEGDLTAEISAARAAAGEGLSAGGALRPEDDSKTPPKPRKTNP
jgi:DNA-directed RNA polymerase specialized sigma24 family protein